MTSTEEREILNALDRLRFDWTDRRLNDVLPPLLRASGFEIVHDSLRGLGTDPIPMEDHGLIARAPIACATNGHAADMLNPDPFTLSKSTFVLGVEYHGPNFNISTAHMHHFGLVRERYMRVFDKVLYLGNSEDHSTWKDAINMYEATFQLFGERELRSWLHRILSTADPSEVALVLTRASSELIRLIARQPQSLQQVEWRDLERVMAEAFTGLGFAVELTPPSHDGGKDIILYGVVEGRYQSYVVEVKHWRAKRIGSTQVDEFLKVVLRESRSGGLFLATGGFTAALATSTSRLRRYGVRLGSEKKIIALCDTYVRYSSGIWQPLDLQAALDDATLQ